MSAAGERHMAAVRALGCLNHQGTPAQAHHIREDRIRNDFLTVPLCYECHLGDFSIHKAKREFTNVYGSELDMLAETIRLLEGTR